MAIQQLSGYGSFHLYVKRVGAPTRICHGR